MTYTAGLIGLSGIGARHQDAYEHVEGIELVAIADVDSALLAERGEEWGIEEHRRYESHMELLAAEDLDAVSIATPSYLHHEHVLEAAESTADPDVIWSEKPIATDVTEAREMVEACETAGIELVVDHMRRFHEPYRTLRQLINEDGIIGEVQSVHMQQPEELLRNGTHSIDLLTMLLDARAERVFGYLTDHAGLSVEDWDDRGGGGVIITEDGSYVNADCTTPRSVTSGQWLLVGDGGKLEFTEAENKLEYWRLEESEEGGYGTEHVEAELPEPIGDLNDYDAMFRSGGEHIVDLLDGEAKNLSPGSVATHVLEIIVAMFLSHYTGAVIDFPLDRPLQDVTIRSR